MTETRDTQPGCGTIYRLRPTEVRAIRWTGDNLSQIFTLTGRIKQDMPFGQIGIFSPGESGYLAAEKGDWVVKDAGGRVFPMKADAFVAMYEPAVPQTGPVSDRTASNTDAAQENTTKREG